MTEPPHDEPLDVDAALLDHLPGLEAFVRLRTSREIREHESLSDIVQSVCREVLVGTEQVAFESNAAFKGWLYTTALRKIVEKHRYLHAQKRDVGRRERQAIDDKVEARRQEIYATFSTPSVHARSHEELQAIEAAFDRLSDEQREVVTLAKIVGLSHAEIASQLGISESSSRQLLRRGLIRLSTILELDANS